MLTASFSTFCSEAASSSSFMYTYFCNNSGKMQNKKTSAKLHSTRKNWVVAKGAETFELATNKMTTEKSLRKRIKCKKYIRSVFIETK